MKAFLGLIVIVSLVGAVIAHPLSDGGPYREVVDNIEYTFSISNGKATIGLGRWGEPAVPLNVSGVVEIPLFLGGAPVIAINDYAFHRCALIKSVIIPQGVEEVGYKAFSSCRALEEVTIPEGVVGIDDWMFEECSSLLRVNLPCGLKTIGLGAFFGCSSMASVKLPLSLRNIGVSAFEECRALVSINIPEGVETVQAYAFCGCKSLVNVAIPKSVVSIEEQAFSYCSAIESIVMPDNLTSIGSEAFIGCEALQTLVIPKGVTTIGDSIVEYCKALEFMAIPSGVKNLGESFFDLCFSMKNIYIVVDDMGDAKTVAEKLTKYDYGIDIIYLRAPEVLLNNVSSNGAAVMIASSGEQGVVHYTIDNTEPTFDSPIYRGPFEICDSCVVRAVVVMNGVKSGETRVKCPLRICEAPRIQASLGCEFSCEENVISLVSECDDCIIRYTLDGSDPKETSNEYIAPFVVKETTLIKARSFCERHFDSNTASLLVVRKRRIVTDDVNGLISVPEGAELDDFSIEIMVRGNNIRPYLVLPVPVNGVVDLSRSVVRPEIVAEVMEPKCGAMFEVESTAVEGGTRNTVRLTTAPTKPGLTYTLVEGMTLDAMVDGDSKLGDGTKWTPEIKVKGGASAFYSIKVTK